MLKNASWGLAFCDLTIWFSSVARETAFDFWGFIFVTLAAVMSGFRWSMTQILLQVRATVMTNVIQMPWELSPPSHLSLFPFSCTLPVANGLFYLCACGYWYFKKDSYGMLLHMRASMPFFYRTSVLLMPNSLNASFMHIIKAFALGLAPFLQLICLVLAILFYLLNEKIDLKS